MEQHTTITPERDSAQAFNGSNSLADLAARIRAEHEGAAVAMRRGVEHAIAAGELLIEAKAQLKHGRWLPWLSDHCAMSERTARLYMWLARNKPEIEKNGNVADLTLRDAIGSMQRSIKHLQLEDARSSYTLENPTALLPAPNAKRKIRVAHNRADKAWMLAIGPSISRSALLQKEEDARAAPTVRSLEQEHNDLLAQAAELEQQAKALRDDAEHVQRNIKAEIDGIIGPVQPMTETYTFYADERTDAALAKLSGADIITRLLAARTKASKGLKLGDKRGDCGYWGDMNLRGAMNQCRPLTTGWTGVGSPDWLQELFPDLEVTE